MNNWGQSIILGLCLLIGFWVTLMGAIDVGDALLVHLIAPKYRKYYKNHYESEDKKCQETNVGDSLAQS